MVFSIRHRGGRQRWSYQPRMLPALLVAGTALFGFKIVAVWHGTETVIATLGTPARAAEEAPEAARPAEVTAATIAKPSTLPADKAADTDIRQEAVDGAAPSVSELEVLQSLAKRRDELADRERKLDMRETMLKAAEQRVDQKIARLAALDDKIQKLVHQNDRAEVARINSLVKVYESMKPKDAARIFEKLDRTVLLDVAEGMKESKMAPILAAMDPAAAQAVTVELATRHQLPEGAATAAAVTGAAKPAGG
jgi:flagellar motility protein MotE (MotC chaperone)